MILKVAVFGALEGVQQVLRTMVESSAISVVKLCAVAPWIACFRPEVNYNYNCHPPASTPHTVAQGAGYERLLEVQV